MTGTHRIIGFTVAGVLLFLTSLPAQFTNLDYKLHNVGKVRQIITNFGTWDDSPDNSVNANYRGLLNCEVPPGSNEEHVFQGGIWIGAIDENGDTLISVSRTHFTPYEFYPTAEPWDTVWVARKGDTLDIPYWTQYTAVSDQDLICRYNDYTILNVENHHPLFLDVIQRSYAWSSQPLDEFIVYNYDVIPTKGNLRNVFVGFWLHGEIGNNAAASNFIDEVTLFYPNQYMGVGKDVDGGDDGNTLSPIGIKILEPADSNLIWTMKWYDHEDLGGFGYDPLRYRVAMSSGEIMQDRVEPERVHMTLAFGPFDQVNVGDTLHFEIGEVFGLPTGTKTGLEKLLENADYLDFLSERDFKVPSPPPSPQLRVDVRSQEIHLNWSPLPNSVNPEEYNDPYRGDNSPQPFEGYRLYKSTISEQGPWTLLAEFDVDSNSYGNNTGLEYEYTDYGLLNNFEYYYTVTSFSKPDSVTNFPSQESSKSDNSRLIIPGTPPPKTVGQVMVVPNPYRGDIAYNDFDPPWEKAQVQNRWMEQDRRIQFTNLPVQCEIRIYTLAGDQITTIRHNSTDRGFEDWNLTSSIGQAISSGIYLFTVEDTKSGEVQVGKFVIIK
ncbi:MAG: hypothetical protein WAN36_14490 [Calditrichia bacterium]